MSNDSIITIAIKWGECMKVYDIRKIQKRVTKSRGKTYYTYYINLPAEWIEDANLKEGDKVEISGDKDKLCLKVVYRQKDEDNKKQ